MGKQHCNVALFVPHAGCPHQCSFCNQRHIAGQVGMPTAEEVRAACDTAVRTMGVEADKAEIAFFGGSFTAIPREDMIALLEAAYPYVRQGAFGGIRVSTRPDAIDDEILSLLCRYGVTAVELGAQSMDDEVLQENGRGHTAAQVEDAAIKIREASLSLGLQMMTGLPGDTDEGARDTARRLADLCPDTVRIYPTLVIEHTPLAQRYREGTYRPQTLEDAIALCTELLTFFEDERGIRVIRLGLHAEQEMEGHCLAGPFHPAFRERCESRRLFAKMKALLAEQEHTPLTLRVHPTCLSQAIGQQKENIRALQALGYTVRVTADDTVSPKDIKVGSD
ncbi:MAG: radical SAM protein [Clostridia bacterium]|nr:radical SAM protein [Clostridia bacterium]